MSTETRTTLAVPSPSPETSMSLGKAWSGATFHSNGFCVATNGRVWLDACGASKSSTLTALSNDAHGQLLLQSLSSNLYLIADKANALSASGSVLLAGGNGVRLFSAHGTTGVFSGMQEKILSGEALTTVAKAFGSGKEYHWVDDETLGTDYFDRMAPSETTADSNTAQAYIDHTDDVASYWSTGILAQSGWTLLMETGFTLKGVTGTGGKASSVALAGQLTALTTWIGIRGVAGILSEPGPAGLDMYTMGSVNWATPGFVSCYSAMGTVLTSGFSVGGLGLVSASVNGGLGAVLKSPWRIGLDGKAAEVIAGTALTLDAKKELNLMGSELQVGAVGGEALTQVPTVSIEALSAKDLKVTSLGKVEQLAGGTAGYAAPTIKVLGNTSVVLKSPAYEINISTSGISISILKATQIAVAGAGVVADCMGGMAVEVGDSVTVGSKASFLEVDSSGAWTWQGPLTTMM